MREQPRKFRKKPVVVEAVQYLGPQTVPLDQPYPTAPAGVFFGPTNMAEAQPYVVTIHDQKCYIEPGDWILPEPDGVHYYPVKPDIFAAAYEPVESPTERPTEEETGS